MENVHANNRTYQKAGLQFGHGEEAVENLLSNLFGQSYQRLNFNLAKRLRCSEAIMRGLILGIRWTKKEKPS